MDAGATEAEQHDGDAGEDDGAAEVTFHHDEEQGEPEQQRVASHHAEKPDRRTAIDQPS